MEQSMVDEAMNKLKQDENFQNAIHKFEEAEDLAQKHSSDMAKHLIEILNLQDDKQTIEQARFNLIVAKMTAAKLLATLSSFSYLEQDFMDSLVNARKIVQDELVPMLMSAEPCGECEACKNGQKDRCMNPKIREEFCESRFLPLLSDALIEYDAWTEILYNNIPAEKRDVDILQDINDDFQNEANQVIKKKGRPPKKDKEE